MFALIDCNNFYASCERVFQPQLNEKPIVILSNNDGCVIARSNEAKDLGIPMGAPAFKFKEVFQKNKVEIFSSNFTLYGDMSNRVMSIISRFVPDVEIYSIDEAFLRFNGFTEDEADKKCKEIIGTVWKWTGIPVSIGLAPTKSLAKIANRIAKKSPDITKGFYSINSNKKRLEALGKISTGDQKYYVEDDEYSGFAVKVFSEKFILEKSDFHNKTVDILIKNGIISNIDTNIKNSKNYKELKFNNLSISPGWFDYSICTGEPGYEERDNVLNTLVAAAKSGYTSIGIQPNTNPIIDKRTEIEYLKSLASNSNIDIFPIGALTKESKGIDLAEILEMGESGAIGFGDFKKPIKNPNLLKLALLYSKERKYPIFSFPFEKRINGDGVMNEGVTSTLMGLKGIPNISEELNIRRDLAILEYTGGYLHIPTILTTGSVDLIRNAKNKKLKRMKMTDFIKPF
mgnify:CR=1 FL=1